jgi:uncharacterized protein YkwD
MRRIHRFFLILLVFFGSFLAIYGESDQEKQMFEYMNSERSREGLRLLQWDKALYKVAMEHSKDMAAMHKVSHRGSDGTQPHERIRKAKIYASKTAENIAGDINIVSAHTSLMKSLYHRENILDPDFTHGTVAVYEQKGYLYITEMFIEKLTDYSIDEARAAILNHINEIRSDKRLAPLSLSKNLSSVAQSHVEVQTRLSSMSPLMIMGVISRQMKGSVLVNVYTTDSLRLAPDEVTHNFTLHNNTIGIGFKKAQGSLCNTGCYVVALIFGSSQRTPAS